MCVFPIVWADYEADQCVVVEMLEQSEIEDGKEALRDYFAKQMDHNNTKAGSVGLVEEINLPIFKEDPENPHVKGAWTGVLVGSQAISKGREAAMNEVRLMMTLVRLPEHSVDIVVIFNDPTMVSGDSSAAQTMEMFIKDGEGNMIVSATAVDAMPLFGLYNAMITSLRVADWGLFGG